MPKSTYQEATLMLQLAQWGAAAGFSAASSWLWSDEFVKDFAEFTAKHPSGSEARHDVAVICSYFETLGTLWKHGLLNEDLIFDWIAVSMTWDRVSSWALGIRQRTGSPRLFENFEALAKANVAYDAKLSKRPANTNKRKK